MCHIFFYGTNNIILLCEDLIKFLFVFFVVVVVVAVLFLLLPKRLSKDREHYKGIEVFI